LRLHSPTERWSTAQTANVSIGQGYDLVSPLQLVMAYSAIANGGTAYEPRLVEKITDCDGSAPPDFAAEPHVRARLAEVGVTPADLELVRTGFWKVVNEEGGTAGRARLPGGVVAGKTGTAQAQLHGKQDTIAWFVGFAPYENPRYAVCVMVQGGAHGGSVAAPIAAGILQETLAMESGTGSPPGRTATRTARRSLSHDRGREPRKLRGARPAAERRRARGHCTRGAKNPSVQTPLSRTAHQTARRGKAQQHASATDRRNRPGKFFPTALPSAPEQLSEKVETEIDEKSHAPNSARCSSSSSAFLPRSPRRGFRRAPAIQVTRAVDRGYDYSFPSSSISRYSASVKSLKAAAGSMMVSRRPPTSSVIFRKRPR
jgi:membrane peptidoglycan carboxypeptidase